MMSAYSLRIKAASDVTTIRDNLNWEALAAARLREPAPPEDWVIDVLSLTKNPRVPARLVNRLLPPLPLTETGESRLLASDGLRAELASNLDLIVRDHRAARQLILEISLGLADVLALPVILMKRGRGPVLTYQVVCNDLRGAICYALWLLLNDAMKLGERLRRCPACSSFFLKTPSQRRYCSRACMSQADAANSRDRVAASREGLSVRQWRAQYARKSR